MSKAETIDDKLAVWATDSGRPRLFSGHESFACRYGWLVKLYHAVEENPELFANDEDAIIKLGLGRNMVKSIRFWGQAFGLTRQEKRRTLNSNLAHRLMHPSTGLDPYLEDIGTLWRLHWQIATHAGLGAWTIVLQDVLDARITRERLIAFTEARAAAEKGAISTSTATAHVDIFLRTYDWARGDVSTGLEEGAGSPFQELKLIETAQTSGGVVISVNRGPKPELRISDFAFALRDYWIGTAPSSKQLSVRTMQLDKRSPASTFRLDEGAFQIMLEGVAKETTMTLEGDGVGGKALVSNGKHHFEELEVLAWPTH